MLGATGVGKTSLVRQFVQSIFSDKYHSTIGVKIDKKIVVLPDNEVNLMLWDIQGEDEEYKIRSSFLRGASGFLLVVDLTRHETLITAYSIMKMVEREIGELPFLVLFNKEDLREDLEIQPDEIEKVIEHPSRILQTSAKTGKNVEEAFFRIAQEMV